MIARLRLWIMLPVATFLAVATLLTWGRDFMGLDATVGWVMFAVSIVVLLTIPVRGQR